MTTQGTPSRSSDTSIEDRDADGAGTTRKPFDIAWFDGCHKHELDHSDGVVTGLLTERAGDRHWLARYETHSSASASERLKRELEWSARIRLPWGLPQIATLWQDERVIVIYPLSSTATLASNVDPRQLTIDAFLRIAIGATRALSDAHAAGICHGDLRPACIVLGDDGTVSLIGFDPEAPKAYRERLSAQPFLAPELGIIDAEPDHKREKSADLYALGVTLYALLAGALPFTAESAAGWYHARLAVEPLHPSRHRPDVPDILSVVLLRLMAKDPLERYTSATQALADLQLIRDAIRLHGHETPLAADAAVSSRLLSMSSMLFGRAAEKAHLDRALARVVETGKTELVFISGSAGSGKSALVESLFNDVRRRAFRYASGKADKQRSGIPYAPVVQIVRTLTLELLGADDDLLAAVRERWIALLEGQGRAVAELVPEVEHIIGRCTPLAEVAGPLAQTRLIRALLNTIAAFASPGAPVVLFVDDLQWADPASLSFLKAFSAEPPPNVLLLCACREFSAEQVGQLQWQHALRDSTTMHLTHVPLHSLSVANLAALIGFTLGESADRVEALARAVHAKTGGNPFFSRQLLRMLIDDEVLRFSVKSGAWTWDETSIAQRLYSDNVIDLLVRRIERFPPEGTKLLESLACVGIRCETGLLAEISGLSNDEVHHTLRPFVDANLLVQDSDSYAFQHDRVLESAYSRIDSASKPLHHAHIASAMIGYWQSRLAEYAFEIASQIERAAMDALSPDTRVAYVGILILAGKRARNAAALDQATVYANIALAMVDEPWWSSHYDLAYGAKLQYCECSLAQAALVDAQRGVDDLLAHPLTPLHRADVHRLKAVLKTVQSDYEGALSAALAGLALLDVHLHRAPTAEQMRRACESAQRALKNKTIHPMRHLPRCDDPRIQVIMGLLATMTSSFFVTDGVGILHLAKMVELTIEHGVTPESPSGLAWFGVLFAGMYDAPDAGYEYGQAALALIDQHGFEAQRVATLVAIDQVSVWTRPLSFALGYARQARALGRASGDIGMACYACNHIVSDLIAMGEHLSIVDDEVERGLELTAIIRYRDIEAVLQAQRDFARALMSAAPASEIDTDNASTQRLEKREVDNLASVSQIARFFIFFYGGLTKIFARDFAAAFSLLDKAADLAWTVPAHINVADSRLYRAIAFAHAENVSPTNALVELSGHRSQFVKWANRNGATFRNKLLLIEAEIARLRGDVMAALIAYEHSARAAETVGFVHEQGLAHELAGELYLSQTLESSAMYHLRQAAACYRRWGAVNAEQRLHERHASLLGNTAEQTEVEAPSRQQPFVDLGIETAKIISGEAVTERLVEKLLNGIVVYAGAQYGLLLLSHDDGLKVVAMARVESTKVVITHGNAAPDDDALPLAVLNSVVRTRNTLVFADAGFESPSLRSRVGAGRVQRSVLCTPLLRGGSLVGVVYLENNLAPGVFDPTRVTDLEVLAPQVAVSLETARLYERLVDESDHRLNAEISLRAARDELARTAHLTVMGNVAASIAHEVNQPLAAITTTVDASLRWLQRAPADLEEVTSGLMQIKRTSLRALEIIRALRALAKQAPAVLAPMRVNDVVRDVLDLLQPEAEARQVSVVSLLDAADATVEADRIQLQQVVLNLFTNAVEAMSETAVDRRTLTISTLVEGAQVVMSVRDHGAGIPDHVMERIFEPLYTTKSTGMGMGLAICRSIVEAHHGTLDAFGLDDGAEFRMTLPIA
ncbi:Predicted ATPase [Paraburkholderia tropica]|uniref:histidine kinase n=1 Tax=Paraburkholderia tropica TaxID=92647 RepID=A0AAQ1GM48_9BURK|nr:GAF domain-containing protein [Paraburkholderia tropica]SEK12184.1 Predicted ATPase [Paraburkholderia tropica]